MRRRVASSRGAIVPRSRFHVLTCGEDFRQTEEPVRVGMEGGDRKRAGMRLRYHLAQAANRALVAECSDGGVAAAVRGGGGALGAELFDR